MVRFARSGTNWEGRKWILNPAVDALCGLVEEHWPEPHGADGTVASKAHDQTNPNSDHRPFPYSGPGVVYAVDVGEVTEDDGAIFAEALRASRDPRIRYVIHETRLFSSYATSTRQPWAWGPYSGANPHSSHVHVSVWRTAGPGEWSLDLGDDMPDHAHVPMPSELPREWANTTWAEWVARSGTVDSSRGWTFYREDLSWVYSRVIRPLEAENATLAAAVTALTARVAALEASGGTAPHTHTFQGRTALGG